MKKTGNKKKSPSAAGPLRAKAGHNTRQEILDAAAIVFSEKGYDAASLRDIASHVGIRPPSVYAHFSSKNEILYTVVTDATTKLLNSCQKSVADAKENPRDKLIAFVESHIKFELDMREVIPMMDSQLFRASNLSNALDVEQKDHTIKLQRQIVDILRNILNEGKESGVMKFSELAVTTYSILGTIEHVTYWFRPNGMLTATEIGEEIAQLALNSVCCK